MFRHDETRAGRERLAALAREGRERRGPEPATHTEAKLLHRLGLVEEPSEFRPLSFALVGALVLGGLGALVGSRFGVAVGGLAAGALVAVTSLLVLDRAMTGPAAQARARAATQRRLDEVRAAWERLPFELVGLERLLSSTGHVVHPTLRVTLLDGPTKLEPSLVLDLMGLVDEEGRASTVTLEDDALVIKGRPLDLRDGLHRWARGTLEQVLVAVHAEHPIARVEVSGFVSDVVVDDT